MAFPMGFSGAHRHELDVKCWAMLFAHVSGFAAINCFGDLQQAPRFVAWGHGWGHGWEEITPKT